MSEDTFKYLSGPSVWFEFDFVDDNGNKKTIELFGDIHNMEGLCEPILKCMRDSKSPKSSCEDINYLLEDLFENAVKEKVHVDLFIEAPYNIYKKDIYEFNKNNYLSIIFNHFYECFTTKKEKCKYLPYVRMNYTDLRSSSYFVNDESLKDNGFSINDLMIDSYTEMLSKFAKYDKDSNSEWTKDRILKSAAFINLLIDNIFNMSHKLFMILLLEDDYQSKYDKIFNQLIEYMESNPNKFDKSDIIALKNTLRRIFKATKVVKDKKDVNQFIIKKQIDELRKENIAYKGKNIADELIDYFGYMTQETLRQNYPDVAKMWKVLYQNIVIWYQGAIQYETLEQELKSNRSKDIENALIQLNQELQDLQIQIVEDGNQFFRDFYNTILELDSYYLDSYILARMFRSFTDKKQSRLSIVYAGQKHAMTQHDFFTKVLKIKPNDYPSVKRGKKAYRCMRSEDFSNIFNIKRFTN
jgi:hypothetical protein